MGADQRALLAQDGARPRRKNNQHPTLSNRFLSRLGKGRIPIIDVRRPPCAVSGQGDEHRLSCFGLSGQSGAVRIFILPRMVKASRSHREWFSLRAAWQATVSSKTKNPKLVTAPAIKAGRPLLRAARKLSAARETVNTDRGWY